MWLISANALLGDLRFLSICLSNLPSEEVFGNPQIFNKKGPLSLSAKNKMIVRAQLTQKKNQ